MIEVRIYGKLRYNPENGRYGLLVSDMWENDGFHCGESLQVKVDDHWVDTTMEMTCEDGQDTWHLTGTEYRGETLEFLDASINRKIYDRKERPETSSIIRLPVEKLTFIPNHVLPIIHCRYIDGSGEFVKIRYFDQNGIFHIKTYEGKNIPPNIHGITRHAITFSVGDELIVPGTFYHVYFSYSTIQIANQFFREESPNVYLFKSVVKKMKEGDTWEHFVSLCEEAQFNPKFERLLSKIEPPVFERIPENKKKNTFDFIRIEVRINNIYENRDLTMKAIRKYKPQIFDRVLSHLENNRSFQKYGVPINFLKLTNLMFTQQDILIFIFELKTCDDNDGLQD